MGTGVWLLAGTALEQRYPCRCRERTWKWCRYNGDPVSGWSWNPGCPCWGRLDRENLPAHCCARLPGV
jgi:hypothetical protein